MPLVKPKGFFVTGTDTCIGKTTVTKTIIRALQHKAYVAIGCKPIACGYDDLGQNEDVSAYVEINSLSLSKQQINSYSFDLAASPHLAAKQAQQAISIEKLVADIASVFSLPADFIFVEGAGGWKVPLNNVDTLADLAQCLALPIILVVGLKVGCLNHALLTFDAIKASKLTVAGVIGNVIEPTTPALEEHIDTLTQWISAPYLGTLPFHLDSPTLPVNFNLARLIQC